MKKTGTRIHFDSSEAVQLLGEFGILEKNGNRVCVAALENAMKGLPPSPNSVILREDDPELGEGYDRDEFSQTMEMYEKERQKSKAYGWGS